MELKAATTSSSDKVIGSGNNSHIKTFLVGETSGPSPCYTPVDYTQQAKLKRRLNNFTPESLLFVEKFKKCPDMFSAKNVSVCILL